ncbi:hypothetical protein ACH4T9_19900 [Micromonospora sp. NPDC020750]|uniref:hypothetical protein n=1 Tax=unclassified Micromonospora TaxID=2617518 RepID=UPI0037A2FC8A
MTDQTTHDAHCGATDNPAGIWRCTKPAGHSGDRHTAEVPGIGSFTWGYVPGVDEDADQAPIPPYTDTDVDQLHDVFAKAWTEHERAHFPVPQCRTDDQAEDCCDREGLRAALDALAAAGRLAAFPAGIRPVHVGRERLYVHDSGTVKWYAEWPVESGWKPVYVLTEPAVWAGPCPCTCHQPDRCPCKPGTPEHRHGAGGYCTVADQTATTTPPYVHHLLDAFLTGQPLNFGRDPVPLDVQRRLEHAVATGQMGTVPWPVPADDRPTSGHVVTIAKPAEDRCYCEDPAGRRHGHAPGAGQVCGRPAAEG